MQDTKRLNLYGWLLLGLSFMGCTPMKESAWFKLPLETKKTNTPTPAKPLTAIPKLEVAGQNLGESQEVGLTAEILSRTVTDLLEARREVSASRWVARHPDAALELLRQGPEAKFPAPTLAFIARVHDRQTLRMDSGASWERLVQQRIQPSSDAAKYYQKRAQFLHLLSQGQAAAAQQLQLAKVAEPLPFALLQIDAWQLQGTAALLAERPADAATAFQKAIALANNVSGYQTAYLQLMLSDAQRRAGDASTAVDTWLAAIQTATELLDPQHPCTDPVLWERLAYARPVSVAWPETLLQKLQAIDPLQHSHSQGNPLAGEPQLWNCIGRWYLDRGHHQAALVAFKRAEAGVSDSVTKQFLRFRQARALVLLDQTGPATAILVSMANDSRSPCARPALALLGSMRLQAGQATQGLHLLKKAVEPEDALEWLERADAEADLALALLMVGDEASGLQRLHRAQQRFEQQDAFESLTLSLFNEANYLAEQKKKSEAEILRQRLQSLERL